MILITTDADLVARGIAFEDVEFGDLRDEALSAAALSEDVYFWRTGDTRAIKRRNAPLVVPDWLKDRKGVDL